MSIFFDHTNTLSRIVGGEPAGLVPYVVALVYGADVRNLICGASLVTTRHVLTAAHCIEAVLFPDGSLISTLRGYVGTNRYDSGGTPYNLTEGIIHPNYDDELLKSDIGFLVTSSDVELTDSVSLIALTFRFINAGVRTSVTGWGSTGTGLPLSKELLQLNAIVVDGNECVTLVKERSSELDIDYVPPVDPALEICTYTNDRAGTCNGDSGSALVDRSTGEQIGTVSWGIPCAQGAPDMFARVSAFREWIEETIA
ncbi:chymotrypsin-1-like [Melitaea cinxia]|uniref:chymotrypsin-1-like n=1 Tax=Melitaea cinxia TaxID=113334 RepID=UPI001E271982|nr:chymotrypsin-1-like [Melitaea cinxia]